MFPRRQLHTLESAHMQENKGDLYMWAYNWDFLHHQVFPPSAAAFGNACSDLIHFYCSQAWCLCVCVSIHERMWLAGRLRPVFCASPRGMQVKAISVLWKPARCAFLHPESWWADSFLIGSSSDTSLPPNLHPWQPPHHQAKPQHRLFTWLLSISR